jgi:hypothetical protein
MIQFDTNGNLYYIDSQGNKISHSPNDGLPYALMSSVRSQQIQATQTNASNAAAYGVLLSDAQAQNLAGHPYTVPVKPLMTVISDTGDKQQVPFDPPLADFVPRVEPVSGGMFPPGAGVGTAQDPNAKMQNQVDAIFHLLFPGA